MNIKRAFLGLFLVVCITSIGWTQNDFKLDMSKNIFRSSLKENRSDVTPKMLPFKEIKPMITNRPGVSESSKAVFKGGFQIETGIQYAEVYKNYSMQIPNIGLLYGLSDRVEIRMFTTLNVNEYDFNNMDIYAGVKINILEQKKNIPELALVFNQEIPRVLLNKTNHIDLYWRSNFITAWSYAFPKRISIAGNFKYVLRSKSNEGNWDIQNQFGYTFNCGYEIQKSIGVFAEIYGDKIAVNNIEMIHNMDGGLWYRIDPSFQIDAQAGFSLNSDYYFIMIGFSKLILN